MAEIVPEIEPLSAYWPTSPPIQALPRTPDTAPLALLSVKVPVPSARPTRPPTVYSPDTLPLAELVAMLPVVRPATPPAAPTPVPVAVMLAALVRPVMDEASL